MSIDVGAGEIFGVIGLSGAGKSTLVRCINLLERPTDGEVIVDGRSMTALSEKQLHIRDGENTVVPPWFAPPRGGSLSGY